MAKPVISNTSRSWLMATARCLLLLVVCQSVLATTLPIGATTDCSPADDLHIAHEQLLLDSAQAIDMVMDQHDHADCEHCVFCCQFLSSHSATLVNTSETGEQAGSHVLSLTNPSLDLPFRPPIPL